MLLTGFAADMPEPALADNGLALAQEGRRLFFEETFDGNGRTCGTCHPATNSFTIDPAFIRTVPKNDPLFVAEFNPDLKELENSRLLRKFGLILENLDGFDRPGVMRGVPHNIGLRVSRKSNLPGVREALGWSGDGSPDGDPIRSFAIGAIRQHFPKTLNREEGVDFRLPTNAELDALEAFLLFVGRQKEINLKAMTFTEEIVEEGKRVFRGEGTNRACTACHENAGANQPASFGGFNANFNQGTQALTPKGAPPDGGFGTEKVDGIEGFGDGTMNTASLIEAADTPPFFHNNSAKTLEDAIRFYTTDIFGESPAGQINELGAFELNRRQIRAISSLLRTLNARDNISFANRLAVEAQSTTDTDDANDRIREAMADTDDAIRMLTRGPAKLYREAVKTLRQAKRLQRRALRKGAGDERNDLLDEAIELTEQASDSMVQ